MGQAGKPLEETQLGSPIEPNIILIYRQDATIIPSKVQMYTMIRVTTSHTELEQVTTSLLLLPF